jgi:hypothetical protein
MDITINSIRIWEVSTDLDGKTRGECKIRDFQNRLKIKTDDIEAYRQKCIEKYSHIAEQIKVDIDWKEKSKSIK